MLLKCIVFNGNRVFGTLARARNDVRVVQFNKS